MQQKCPILLFFVCVALVLYADSWLETKAEAQENRTHPDLKGLSFSDDDAQIIKHGDLRSADHVITKLWRLLGREGKEAVRPAVPALVYRLNELEKISSSEKQRPLGELHVESVEGIIDLLARIGDERSKSVLLEGMKHGIAAAPGLMAIGRSVVPDVINSLGSTRFEIRWGAMITLREFATMDPNFLTKEEKDDIRKRLHSLLEDSKVRLKTANITALEVYGDATTIPILEKIAERDLYRTTSRARYVNRIVAKRAIEEIKAAQQSRNEAQSPVNSE